jgi:hypothetical protein
MTNENQTPNRNYVEEGFLPIDQWKATDVHGRLLIATQNTQDFKDMHLHNMPGVTIIRNYTKVESVWIKEDPFPDETAGGKAMNADEVIKFCVDGLGIELDPWQEDLIRTRVHGDHRALKIQPKSD